ncbi:putative lipase [Aspergillus stella-maris]|uniref:putative lipase n=1 Tax=Aspergillus stella-maris TaxID=1810926 RepID=UPI003CCD8D4B
MVIMSGLPMPGPIPGLQDLVSILAQAANDPLVTEHPSVDHGLLSGIAALLSIDITTGKPGQDQCVEDAWNTVQDAKAGKTNPLDMANTPAGSSIYPKSKEDAPYSVEEDDLRAAIYIPESFQYGKNRKKPVILVLGTAVPAGLTYYFSFGRLAEVVPEADVVWVNIPSTSSEDVAVTSEYIAYATNYISAVSESNVAIIAWSQGNLNTQWSFKYWPSTRDVVYNYIAISPDYHGTVLADAICPLLTGIFCPPAFFQQRYETDFIEALRADGGGSAYVPTTTVYSTFDEIVQPQSGPNASAILDDNGKVGVSNNHAQTVCANQPAGGLYTHEGMLYNPLTWALAADALRHGGPGNVSRIDTKEVCADVLAPQLGPDDLLGSEGLILVAVAESLAYAPKPLKEPPVASYAL